MSKSRLVQLSGYFAKLLGASSLLRSGGRTRSALRRAHPSWRTGNLRIRPSRRSARIRKLWFDVQAWADFLPSRGFHSLRAKAGWCSCRDTSQSCWGLPSSSDTYREGNGDSVFERLKRPRPSSGGVKEGWSGATWTRPALRQRDLPAGPVPKNSGVRFLSKWTEWRAGIAQPRLVRPASFGF
jgi:hypothetical protein